MEWWLWCVTMWETRRSKDSSRGEETFNHVWKYGLFFGSVTWRNSEKVPEGGNWTRHPIYPHVRLAGESLMFTFCWCLPPRISASPRMSFTSLSVCSPSVTPWMSAKQNSKLSHLGTSVSTHRAKTTSVPSVLCLCTDTSPQPLR